MSENSWRHPCFDCHFITENCLRLECAYWHACVKQGSAPGLISLAAHIYGKNKLAVTRNTQLAANGTALLIVLSVAIGENRQVFQLSMGVGLIVGK